jgi:hypothetical protein
MFPHTHVIHLQFIIVNNWIYLWIIDKHPCNFRFASLDHIDTLTIKNKNLWFLKLISHAWKPSQNGGSLLYPYQCTYCRNPSLGLTTKVMACKGVGQEWSPGVTFHVFGSVGVWESVREWTSTLPNELPLWELESWWSPDGVPNFQRAIVGDKTH